MACTHLLLHTILADVAQGQFARKPNGRLGNLAGCFELELKAGTTSEALLDAYGGRRACDAFRFEPILLLAVGVVAKDRREQNLRLHCRRWRPRVVVTD